MVDDRMQDKALLEAALFLSPEPLTYRALAKLLDASQPYVRALLEEMQADLAAAERGLELQIDPTRAAFQVKRAHVDRVAHLAPQQDIQRSVLRTLAVVAYNQPVTQADVVKVRGNKAYAHIQELLERGLIRGEQQGRTSLLEVTDEFLRYFGLSSREEFRFHFAGDSVPDPEQQGEQEDDHGESRHAPESQESDAVADLEQERQPSDYEPAAPPADLEVPIPGRDDPSSLADHDNLEAGG
ncbi:SMC-Scp complex subunit ScpB [Candidatus Bipolaricaulota bacterium]|nr:SMC-Scp complex subunit ScpB [Candidatus Bipolaricaulota bacterium]